MFIKEGEAIFYQLLIGRDVKVGILSCLQDHQTEFQYRIPLVFQPCIPFYTGGGTLFELTVFRGIRQSEVLCLFGKTGSVVVPVIPCPCLGVRQHPQVGIKLRLHQVGIATLQHRPIDQPLVLSGHRTTAPLTVVGREGGSTVYIDRVEGEHTAIELGRPLAVGVAS